MDYGSMYYEYYNMKTERLKIFNICAHIYTCIHTYVYMYVYILYIHICIHTNTHPNFFSMPRDYPAHSLGCVHLH